MKHLFLLFLTLGTFLFTKPDLKAASLQTDTTISQIDSSASQNIDQGSDISEAAEHLVFTIDEPENLLGLGLVIAAFVTLYLNKTLKNLKYWQSTLLGLGGTIALGILKFAGDGTLNNIAGKDLPALLLPLIWGWVSKWINDRDKTANTDTLPQS
ncbi:hypothetical protein [Xanthocytophaga agilis]|uniref:Uncharacterized protein n=1 Tax=Xanthocytophaga agilis TaxID=3048010 RepID=A0AAE3R2L7_9BACT|nr:hypothetical protein [Xanthocytophaga agilis]MDJ1500472.1 hypothetical protein [Xanthocytophaga agilis]